MGADDVGKLNEIGRVLEVLHSHSSALFIVLDNDSLQERSKHVVPRIFAFQDALRIYHHRIRTCVLQKLSVW